MQNYKRIRALAEEYDVSKTYVQRHVAWMRKHPERYSPTKDIIRSGNITFVSISAFEDCLTYKDAIDNGFRDIPPFHTQARAIERG